MSLCHWETAYKYFRGWISSDRPTCDLSPHLLKSLWAPDNVLHSLILLPTYFQQKLCHMSCPNLVWLLWWWSGFIRLRCLFAEELRAQTKTWLTCWPVRMEEPYRSRSMYCVFDLMCYAWTQRRWTNRWFLGCCWAGKFYMMVGWSLLCTDLEYFGFLLSRFLSIATVTGSENHNAMEGPSSHKPSEKDCELLLNNESYNTSLW